MTWSWRLKAAARRMLVLPRWKLGMVMISTLVLATPANAQPEAAVNATNQLPFNATRNGTLCGFPYSFVTPCGECDCIPGFLMRDNKMQCMDATCPDGQTQFPDTSVGTCECIDKSLEMDGSKCVPRCPDGSKRTLNGSCSCSNATYEQLPNGTCVQPCSPYSMRTTKGNCECIPGYVRVNDGRCDQACPSPDQVRSPDMGTCECRDSRYEMWASKCKPRCPGGFERFQRNGTCLALCPVGSARASNGTCVCSGPNMRLRRNSCVCLPGYGPPTTAGSCAKCTPGNFAPGDSKAPCKRCQAAPTQNCPMGFAINRDRSGCCCICARCLGQRDRCCELCQQGG